eukprot:Phypoly_transcript_03941.p1 GENE.Phypoly_transcript_03941~~Phypoly_transcript_03941.p1  ORF type:complete len:438 (+),score=59.35 Phypoly_transcript_03941:819-2132(+)
MKEGEEDYKRKGNECFVKKDFTAAIQWYTQALSQEPTNHLILSNRSAAYEETNNLEEALKDAISCTQLKPDWVKGHFRKGKALLKMGKVYEAWNSFTEAASYDKGNTEVQEHIAKCTELLKQANSSSSYTSVVSLPKADSDFLEKLMDGFPITVDMVPKKGRGVVATRALQKGSILYVDVPYVSQVLFENKIPFITCNHCMKVLSEEKLPEQVTKSRFKVCQCGEVYCTQQCQDEAYQQHHKSLCASGNKINELKELCIKNKSEYGLMIAKIYARILQAIDRGENADDAWRSIGLLPCLGGFEVPPEQEESLSAELKLLQEILPDPRIAPLFSMEKYKRICTKFMLNSFRVDIPFEKKKCSCRCLFILGSFFNHSCEPNCEWKVQAGTHKVNFVASKKIKKGEEICISYIDHTLPKSERLKLLRDKYRFDCCCPKCT